MNQRLYGTLRYYHMERKFGFVTADDGKEYFIHASNVEGERQKLEVNQRLSFEEGKNDKGRMAIHVKILALHDADEDNWHDYIGPVPNKD